VEWWRVMEQKIVLAVWGTMPTRISGGVSGTRTMKMMM